MSESFSKIEIITGIARRRRFTAEQKMAIIAETMQPGVSMSYVARRHGLSPSLVFRWRSLMSFKRDYVRINALPDAETAISQIEKWMDDYNEIHPHSRLGYLSPREYIRAKLQPAACPV